MRSQRVRHDLATEQQGDFDILHSLPDWECVKMKFLKELTIYCVNRHGSHNGLHYCNVSEVLRCIKAHCYASKEEVTLALGFEGWMRVQQKNKKKIQKIKQTILIMV